MKQNIKKEKMTNNNSNKTPKELSNWRKEIDKIDTMIMEQIAQRVEVVKQVGEYKKENNMPFLDTKRKNQLLEHKIKLAKEKNLSPELTKELYTLIHDYSLAIEETL